MSRDLLADATIAALAKTLDGAAARHRAIAENIANADTPGFQRSDVSFESDLEAALKQAPAHPRTALDRIRSVRVRTVRDRSAPLRADGNTVDIEREVAHLADNTMRCEAAGPLESAETMASETLRSPDSSGRSTKNTAPLSIILILLFLALAVIAFAMPAGADSLWTVGSGSLFTDHKARSVGDVVTVIIMQQIAGLWAAGGPGRHGDTRQTLFATQAFANTLERPGTAVEPGLIKVKNFAPVMLDGALADEMAQSGSLGLGTMLYDQLSRVVLGPKSPLKPDEASAEDASG